jgi:phage portal protein BeeE
MTLGDRIREFLGLETVVPVEYVTFGGPRVSEVLGMGPEMLYRTQPHLRTVTTFLARNFAQLPAHVYQRVADEDRRRVKDSPVARLLEHPNPGQTWFDLAYRWVMDRKLFDMALWMLVRDRARRDTGWSVYPIPPAWILGSGGGSKWAPAWVDVSSPWGDSAKIRLDADGQDESFVMFPGFDPAKPLGRVSPIDALREILAEQIEAWKFRQDLWRRGARVGAVMTRPADAPEWSVEARARFQREWAAKYGADGSQPGGIPLLEDGMRLERTRFGAREEEWSEAAKLSLAAVAAVYHTSPTMVGILDNANYSNVREFSRMLYTDTLGPDIAEMEARLNHFLLPKIDADADLYVELNLAQKLAGSFEEQAQVLSTSVGRPWMTANEARAKQNLPALPGGDDLVTPLNVIVGGQASPRDSGTQNLRTGPPVAVRTVTVSRESQDAPIRVKSGVSEEEAATAANVLRRFFRRQRKTVLAAVGAAGAKAATPGWWDTKRWNRELRDDLYGFAYTTTQGLAGEVLGELDLPASIFSIGLARGFLTELAASRASAINAATLRELESTLESDEPDPGHVFDVAEEFRADEGGQTFATTVSGFAVYELGKQVGEAQPGRVTKTWVVNSGKPRSSHAAMDGETVPVGAMFSNGMEWPGDLNAADLDEVCGCQCTVEINIE